MLRWVSVGGPGVEMRRLRQLGSPRAGGLPMVKCTFRQCAALAVLALAAMPAGAQSVRPDAATSTTATVGAGGKTTVTIAPANARGVSHNTYSRFDVPTTGVDLDNATVRAGTIVNEVTSASRSTLEGLLSVLGPQANVIIANPNGITIAGASFANIGGLGLIAGRVGYVDGKPEIALADADITVTTAGLVAAINQLDLAARALRVDGAISDSRASKTLAINLTAGSGKVAVDPAADPAQPAGWLTTTAGAAAGTEKSIVISSGATLNGGSIRMTATDAGAGVRLSGQSLAAAGDFLVTAAGKVVVEDATIEAQRDVAIIGRSVAAASATRQSNIRAVTGGVLLDGQQGVTSSGVTYRGADRPSTGFAATGAVNLISNDGAIVTAATASYTSSFAGDIEGVAFQAGTTLSDTGSAFTAAKDATFSAVDGITLTRSKVEPTALIRATSDGRVNIFASELNAGTSVIVDAGSFLARSDQGVRTQLRGGTSGVLITATDGDIVNQGALIQGKSRIEGDDRSVGSVTLIASGKVVAETLSAANIGSYYAEADDLSITAAGGVVNAAGRLLADKSVRITTDGALENTTARAGGQTQPRLSLVSSQARGLLSLWGGWRRSTTKTYYFGSYVDGREISNITAVEGIVVNAARIDNIGGEMIADTIALRAGTITNASMLLGSVRLSRHCAVFNLFCDVDISNRISRDGGSIVSTGALAIEATSRFENIGGMVSGVGGVTITAPTARFTAQLIPDAYTRPAGLSGGFAGQWGRVFYSFDGGRVLSASGGITLHVPGRIEAEVTTILAAGAITIDGTLVQYTEPLGLRLRNGHEIGLLREVL